MEQTVDFYAEEIRCSYLVSADMKKLWATEIEVLEVFKEICRKHNITYFAAGGTLLGAARHNGYIPWDDDIDIQLKGDDFDKFCEVVADELPENYFFESYKTENHFRPYHCKIRKTDTNAHTVGEKESNPDAAEGVWIDLFRMDYVPENAIVRRFRFCHLKCIRHLLSGESNSRKMKRYTGKQKAKQMCDPRIWAWTVYKLFTTDAKLSEKYCRLAKYTKPTQKLAATCFRPGNKTLTWDADDFTETVELPFEYTTISAPKNYDKVLTQQYGDWHQFKHGTQYHSEVVMADDKK